MEQTNMELEKRKETYKGFNDALTTFLAEPGPSCLICSSDEKVCHFVPAYGENVPEGFVTLVYKTAGV